MANRNMAEQMINDVVNTIRESQGELEKTLTSYTSGGYNNPLIDVME